MTRVGCRVIGRGRGRVVRGFRDGRVRRRGRIRRRRAAVVGRGVMCRRVRGDSVRGIRVRVRGHDRSIRRWTVLDMTIGRLGATVGGARFLGTRLGGAPVVGALIARNTSARVRIPVRLISAHGSLRARLTAIVLIVVGRVGNASAGGRIPVRRPSALCNGEAALLPAIAAIATVLCVAWRVVRPLAPLAIGPAALTRLIGHAFAKCGVPMRARGARNRLRTTAGRRAVCVTGVGRRARRCIVRAASIERDQGHAETEKPC